jgi:hypothetical protein
VLQVAAWGGVAIRAGIRRQVRIKLEEDPGTATAMNAPMAVRKISSLMTHGDLQMMVLYG